MDWTKILQGKKSYLAAAGLLVTAALQYRAGSLEGALQSVFAALAVFGVRAAIPAPQPPAPPAPPSAPPVAQP